MKSIFAYICFVKPAEKHIGTLLISIAIFLVFGNTAFAHIAFSEKTHSTANADLKADDSGKPLVFDEQVINELSPTFSQNEQLGAGEVGAFYRSQNFLDVQSSSSFICSYSLTDKRELLFRYLFPFHFFW
ncbi:hypothetical protein [Aequorivita marina]|uniref:hypothetical protein n=1 Tax=Aequorivita marina TaxID=3073654 RepID=UPI0028751A66|nr:hypothetical protein [Aequorivita sp. S2608]MDS1297457.1 hypothetical protein [Aequorivita sp. S2608]